MLVVVITAFSCKLKPDRIGSFQFVICGLCSQHGQQALCSFYISRFHISWFIIGGLYFKRGIKNKVRLTIISARALVKKTQEPGIKLQKADFFRNDTWTSPQTNSEDAPKIPLVHFF